MVSAREWTPFGVELALSGVEGAGESQTGLGYTGEWFDADVGLEYLRARWYQPGTGRFTSRDVWAGNVWQPQSLQPYSYANDDPVNYSDPSGYFAEANRQPLLNQRADELHIDTSISAMEKFIGLIRYATDELYDDSETVTFMHDITAAINKTHGRFDQPNYYCRGIGSCNPAVEEQYRNLPYRGLHWRDTYREWEPMVPGLEIPKKCQSGFCDIGWKDKYRDNSGNQAFHFWAYVWGAYFTDRPLAALVNLHHELDPFADPDGQTFADWRLGEKGGELGARLAAWQSPKWKEVVRWCTPVHRLIAHLGDVRPSGIDEWLLQHVADPAAFGPAPVDVPYACNQ